MTAKKILVAGATGLVGYAAMKHFATEGGCEVIAVSRRRPAETFGARWLQLDLTDAAACASLAPEFAGVTHLVYAALHERPGLVAGWIYIMIVSIRELSSSILLYSPGTEVISIIIWELWENGQYVELSALGVMFILMLFVLVMIAQHVGKKFGIKEH